VNVFFTIKAYSTGVRNGEDAYLKMTQNSEEEKMVFYYLQDCLNLEYASSLQGDRVVEKVGKKMIKFQGGGIVFTFPARSVLGNYADELNRPLEIIEEAVAAINRGASTCLVYSPFMGGRPRAGFSPQLFLNKPSTGMAKKVTDYVMVSKAELFYSNEEAPTAAKPKATTKATTTKKVYTAATIGTDASDGGGNTDNGRRTTRGTTVKTTTSYDNLQTITFSFTALDGFRPGAAAYEEAAKHVNTFLRAESASGVLKAYPLGKYLKLIYQKYTVVRTATGKRRATELEAEIHLLPNAKDSDVKSIVKNLNKIPAGRAMSGTGGERFGNWLVESAKAEAAATTAGTRQKTTAPYVDTMSGEKIFDQPYKAFKGKVKFLQELGFTSTAWDKYRTDRKIPDEICGKWYIDLNPGQKDALAQLKIDEAAYARRFVDACPTKQGEDPSLRGVDGATTLGAGGNGTVASEESSSSSDNTTTIVVVVVVLVVLLAVVIVVVIVIKRRMDANALEAGSAAMYGGSAYSNPAYGAAGPDNGAGGYLDVGAKGGGPPPAAKKGGLVRQESLC
jgi:hypothetical protein